jgi:hypothetical protein
MNKFSFENSISKKKNFLINLSNKNDSSDDLNYLINNFCGTVVNNISEISNDLSIRIYLIGNIDLVKDNTKTFFVVKELSTNYNTITRDNFLFIELGQVPISIHNSGVFYRNFFNSDNFFTNITSEHKFQNLTESNKKSIALRKGIYLSKIIKQTKAENESLHFHLLRCSTNLTGPTDNFRLQIIKLLIL